MSPFNTISQGGALFDHLFPFSPPRFDPSFLAPVRSEVPPSAGEIPGVARPDSWELVLSAVEGAAVPYTGFDSTQKCPTNCPKPTSQARLKRAGPTTGLKKNYSPCRRRP